MLLNSLTDLLLANRGHLTVSFTHHHSIPWSQFLTEVRSLTLLLKNKKARSIALCCDDSYLFSVAFFAALYANKKVILPGNHQPAMLTSLSSEFELLVDDGLVAQTTKDSLQQSVITLPLMATPELSSSAFQFTPLDLTTTSITLFTSGSTGQPKAINKTLLMLNEEIKALQNLFGDVVADAAIVSTVSHQHIYGLLFRVLWPLCAGRPFAAKDLTYTEQIIDYANQAYVLISSPALLKRLQGGDGKGHYRAVFSSGGPLSSDASDRCRLLLNTTAFEIFGSTETGGIGFRQQQSIDTPWHFFPEVSAMLGEESCLALTSPWLSEGLKETDQDTGYYQTSDQCDLLENKQFRLKGRVDKIVKIEEKRVSLVEVEAHLNELAWVAESAVIVVTEPQRIALGALLTLTAEGELALQQLGKGRFWIKLRQQLRDWVEPVAIPRHFRITDEIPMNKQGKRLMQDITRLFQ